MVAVVTLPCGVSVVLISTSCLNMASACARSAGIPGRRSLRQVVLCFYKRAEADGGAQSGEKRCESAHGILTSFCSCLNRWRGFAAEPQTGEAERHDQDESKEEVIGHGMRPARGIFQILGFPKQKDSCDHRKLAGDHENVCPRSRRCRALNLVRGQIAFFGGKQGICHRVLSPVSLGNLRDRRS